MERHRLFIIINGKIPLDKTPFHRIIVKKDVYKR